MPIRAFLTDKSLIDSTTPMINLETATLPYGYLDRDTIEYFVEPLEVEDLRDARLPITYRHETGIVISDVIILTHIETSLEEMGEAHLVVNPTQTVLAAQYQGLDYLEFANDVLPVGPTSISRNRFISLIIDAAKLTNDDNVALAAMTSTEQAHLFNVVEYLAYGTVSTDSLSDVDVVLSNNTEYTGYVEETLTDTEHGEVFLYGGINIHRFIPKSIGFSFMLGTHKLDLTVWLNRQSFKQEYPLSTIINIIPPMELHILFDPSSLVDPISSAALGKKWSDAIMRPEVVSRDQSGMYLFETRYIYHGKTYMVTFSIIYRGREPDALEARRYIADYLINSGIGTRALWEVLLPDVFYHSAFLIIPFYDDVTVLTNADIYPSIINANPLLTKINQIVALFPRATHDNHRELMTAAYDKFFIGVAPADINEQSSLLALHPTYRDFSTTDVGFNEMTAEDRDWSVRLNQALAVASGETNLLSVNIVEYGGLSWVNFVVNYASYMVLTEASYKSFFGV